MPDIDLKVENSCLLNLIFFKDDYNLFAKNSNWKVHFHKLFFALLSVFEFLLTKLLQSLFIFYFSSIKIISFWNIKFFNALSSYSSISISWLDYIFIEKTFCIIWLLYVLICFISFFIDFIFFLPFDQLYTLLDNIKTILFWLKFRKRLRKEQKSSLDWNFKYFNVNERVKFIYINIAT